MSKRNKVRSSKSEKESSKSDKETSKNEKQTQDDNVAAQEKADHIERVWRVFRKANPEQRQKLIEQLDEETVTELRARGNPYGQNALYKKQKGDRILLFSLFSPHEKYIDRFSMTSLIGYIFRMLDEYTPEEAKQYPSEMSPEFQKVYDEIVKKFVRDEPVKLLIKEEETITTRLQEIDESLVKLENIAQRKAKDLEDAELSDDEDDLKTRTSAKTLLEEESATLKKTLLETQAKRIAYNINIVNAQIEEHQPMLKSLTKDFERNKDWRVGVKNTLRDLVNEKNLASARLPSTEPKPESDETTVVPESTETPKEDVVVTADELAIEVSDNVTKPSRREKPAKSEKKVTKSVNTKTPSKEVRPYEIVLADIKSHKNKLLASGEALQTATDKLSAHQKMIDELQAILANHRDALDQLQRKYYGAYGSKNMPESAKKDKSKVKTTAPVKTKVKAKKTHDVEAHKTVFSHLTLDNIELSPENEYYLKEEAKKVLGIEKTQEECSDTILDYIEEFLYEYLVFNPDNHVKCAYKPNYKDPSRTPLKIDKKSGMIVDEQFERKLIPPIDTFKRWERYREANYEQLRQATDDIYSEKSDFEWAIVPLETFEGENARERADEWKRKHAKEVDFSIRDVNFNVVGLLGPWEQNRDAQNFYTKETEVLKRMMDTHKEEERFANQMTKERMKKKKKENLEETGPDDGLNEYLGSNPTGLERYGAKRANITASDIPKDDHELADDEVQIEVINLGATRVGRRWKPTSDKWKFHVPAEPLKEGQLVSKNAAQVQKEMAEKEAK